MTRRKNGQEEDFVQWMDPHQKVGLAILILYTIQLLLGLFIHYVKIPNLGVGRRPVQNYVHVFLGLSILVLAAAQVR